MSNDIVEAFGGDLATADDFNPNQLSMAAQQAGGSSQDPIAIFKEGEWSVGVDQEEIPEDSVWAVNSLSFCYGFQEWFDSQPGAELMAPFNGPPVNLDAMQLDWPDKEGHEKHTISRQGAFQMQCVSGDTEGLQAIFKSSTNGGVKAINKLAHEIAKHAAKNSGEIFPLVRLSSGNYTHRKFGRKVYFPVFEITDFVSQEQLVTLLGDVDTEEDVPEAGEEKPAKTPAAKTRKRGDGPRSRGRRRRAG